MRGIFLHIEKETRQMIEGNKSTACIAEECESAVDVVLTWLSRDAKLRLGLHLQGWQTALAKSRARSMHCGARRQALFRRQIGKLLGDLFVLAMIESIQP
jgi:hypothetical protein